MPEEFDAGTGKAKNIMDSFIEALYGQSEETIPEEYDWFAPLLGDSRMVSMVSDLEYIIQRPSAMIWYMHARVNLQICVLLWKMEY